MHTGLLTAAESESEVASVLGHEIAHVTQRHIARQLGTQQQMAIPSLVAMAAGLVDFAGLDEAVVPDALRHMAAVGAPWLGYGIALYLRRHSLWTDAPIETPTIAVSLVSALVLALGGWLGGRLVYSFGAGVSKTLPPAPSAK